MPDLQRGASVSVPHFDFWTLEKKNRRQTAILITVFIILFTALGFGLDVLFDNIDFFDGSIIGFPILTLFALVLGIAQAVGSFYGGSSLVLASVHARELKPDEPKHLMVLDVIREMATAAAMPVPKGYIIDDPAPNAFATGRDPAHSVICVTQGLINEMDREELQGVIGHEMAHVRDYDTRTMMMIAVLVGGIAMLADFAWRWAWFSGGVGSRRERRSDGNSGGADAGALLGFAILVLTAVAPFFSQILAMAVSRQREYLADAGSVEFTRNPNALMRALVEIARTESPLRDASRGTAHLFIVNPLEGAQDDKEDFLGNLLSTHPPLSRRIARLRAMGAQGEPEATLDPA